MTTTTLSRTASGPTKFKLERSRYSLAAEAVAAFLMFWFAVAAVTVFMTAMAKAEDALVRPGDMGFGALLLNSVQDGLYVEAPRMATDVEIDVSGPIVRAKVTQRFTNPSDAWVEGVYVFPLPEDAAVDALKMMIGDRVIEGQIKEKQEARAIYEAAKAQGFKASLMEQERANIFTNSVANIGPGETIVVQIEYQDAARFDAGAFSLRFPMVVAPRFNPAPDIVQTVSLDERSGWAVTDPVPDRDRITPPVVRPNEDPEAPLFSPVTMSLTLAPGFPVEAIESPYHGVIQRKTGRDRFAIALEDGAVEANRDFVLKWTPKQGAEPTAALFQETINGETYILAMVLPQTDEADIDAAARPREVIFVIDNSGSMGGASIVQAKASLLLALDRLGPQDRFNVIRFDDTMDMAFHQPTEANEGAVQKAKTWVNNLEADGGTVMLPALQAALKDQSPTDTSRVRQVIFLTDGAIGNEAQLFSEIGSNLGRTRLFTVGIGSAPNSYFMSRAARLGRGTFTHIGSETEVKDRMAELFQKLERPVMTDLVASFDRGTLSNVAPNPLPDLYAGEPVLLTAKLNNAGGDMRIAGRINEKSWLAELPLSRAAEGKGVSKLWARREIASTEESRFTGAGWDAIDKKVLSLALEHSLVSRLTSLVAVDVTPSRPDGENVVSQDVPVNLPDGWDFDKVFGAEMAPAPAQRSAFAPTTMKSLAMADAAPAQAVAAPQGGLNLPQGALGWKQWLLIGLALWAAAALLMVVRFVRPKDEG